MMAQEQVSELGRPRLIHLAHSTSHQVLWALEELGVEYDITLVERPIDKLPEGLAETHIQAHSPQLILASGEVLTQGVAIVKYLLLRYDKDNRFHHANMTDAQHVRELYLLNFAGADFIRYLGMMLTFVGIETQSPFFIRPLMAAVKRKLASVWLDREIRNSMRLIETELEGRTWLMDTEGPSTPDFVIMYGIELGWKSSFFNIEEFPNVKAFYRRCKDREGWKRAMEKGNGFNMDWVKRFREGS